MGIELNNDQILAGCKLENWWKRGTTQVIGLGGGPGTGKTTVILYMIQRLGIELDEVLFVTYMGKAVSRMIQAGLPAKTIHATCYTYERKIRRDENNEIIYDVNGKPKTQWIPILKDHLPKKIKLIVADEAYTIPEKNALDLVSFDIPIIAVGDPNQLDPPFGKPYFLKDHIDIMLHQIMRQAEGNPIIYLSQKILNREHIPFGAYGTSSVIKKENLTDFALKHADVILTTTNKLRGSINNLFRESYMGFSDLSIPHVGEKLICVANDWSRSLTVGGSAVYLTNGTSGYVDYVDKRSYSPKSIKMDFSPDFGNKSFHNLKVDLTRLNAPLGQGDVWTPPDSNAFEYGYALTIMKCLPLDTLIYTEDGIQQLGDLKEYTGKVYNGEYWEKPSEFIVNGRAPVNNFITDIGIRYSATDDHKCKILTPQGVITKLGKHVLCGDALLVRKNQRLYIDSDFSFAFNNTSLYATLDHRAIVYKLPENVTEDLATVIGMICADGSLTQKGAIQYTKHDKYVCDVFCEKIGNIFGYHTEAIRLDHTDAWAVNIYSTLIWSFFKSLGGLNPNDKYVPKCILRSSTKYQCAFIKGLFEDAAVHIKNGVFDMIVLTFKSRTMIMQLSAILSNIGIRPKITIRKKITDNGYCSLLYNFQIYKHGGIIYRDMIGFISYDKQKRLSTINSDYEQEYNKELASIMIYNWRRPIPDMVRNVIHSMTLTPYTWHKIREYAVEHNSLPEDVIDFIDYVIDNYYITHVSGKYMTVEETACLEMPETHQFIQNCVLGENSQGSQWDNVLILDEGVKFSIDGYYKGLYVAVTRGVNSVTIVR